MSVSSTTNKVVYTGSGTTGPFDFDFPIYVSSDLVVEKYTIATGTTATLTETTDYSVTIDGDGTGHIDTVAAVTSSYKLVIRRVLPITQDIDYVEGDKFPAETHEEGLDRGVMIDQQLQEQIDRAVLQNTTATTQITLPGSVTGEALVWDADGNLVNSDLTGPQGPQGETGAAGADGIFSAIASQAEAEVGTENTKGMTALRTSQAITALQRGLASQAEAEAGSDNTKDMTPLRVSQAITALAPAKTAFGSWESKNFGTSYQASTDGILIGSGYSSAGTLQLDAYTDGSNPPTTARASAVNDANYRCAVTIPVKKNDYYKVNNNRDVTAGNVYFIPLS